MKKNLTNKEAYEDCEAGYSCDHGDGEGHAPNHSSRDMEVGFETNQDSMGHDNPEGSEPLKRVKLGGQIPERDEPEVMDPRRQSDGYRGNEEDEPTDRGGPSSIAKKGAQKRQDDRYGGCRGS
jgi:hypothetical protein